MGIFAAIKTAIRGSGKGATAPAAPAPAPARSPAPAAPASAPAPAAGSGPEPISTQDLASRLEAMPDADRYNWRTSIVDLMKLTGIDPVFENRKELAGELGMADYEGTAEQNIALHHAVMNLLALEGGKAGGILED